MELKECITCGSHSFTDNKCDYCGNQYESTEYYADDKHDMTLFGKTYCDDGVEAYAQSYHEYSKRMEVTELSFDHGNTRGDKILRIMLYLFLSIIWFAVCVFLPQFLLITIMVLIVLVVKKIIKKIKA